MRQRFTVLFGTLWVGWLTAAAQEPAPDALRALNSCTGKVPTETTVCIGRQFLGAPYVPHTLDRNPTEELVVNLRAFDCTTFLETVLALSLAAHDVPEGTHPAQFDRAFRRCLTRLRYRDGRIDGYASRLHYFSDWLRDNERRGLVADVTRELPGQVTVAKPVSYMTTAVYKYPRLTDPVIYRQMAQTEAAISQQSFAFIPKKNARLAESNLREGDIVMLTAARPGQDIKHVGFAVRQPDGRMHLLHASSEQGAVVISNLPLSDYVLTHKRLSGLRIARLREPVGSAGGRAAMVP